MKETAASTNNLLPESDHLNSLINNSNAMSIGNNSNNGSPTTSSNNNNITNNSDLVHHSTSIRSISKFKDKI